MNKKRFIILLIALIGLFLYPFHGADPINYIDHKSSELKTEKVPGEYWLNWLYNNPVGELSLDAFVKRKALSEWYGDKMDSPESAEKIAGFVKEYGINLSESQKQEFTSFNDFFYRKLKVDARPYDKDSTILISPADGKLFAYTDVSKQDFIVKGYKFNLEEYLQDEKLAKQFEGGSLIIVRLCPTDYHRLHFPFSGTIKQENKKIEGDLYSVSPIAIRHKVRLFCMNKREYTLLNSDVFGDVVYSEVGATMVGSIIQTHISKTFEKSQEKGYFKFGGSTVIMLFEKGEITIDQDLLDNTSKGLETAVLMGETIARKKQ
ncbi:MAG: phosphatidylserine decarboxylase [Flavobacteriales bacterium]|nr:phosphatidylserine decarboxylase [Flavobacteriales bacterium]